MTTYVEVKFLSDTAARLKTQFNIKNIHTVTGLETPTHADLLFHHLELGHLVRRRQSGWFA